MSDESMEYKLSKNQAKAILKGQRGRTNHYRKKGIIQSQPLNLKIYDNRQRIVKRVCPICRKKFETKHIGGYMHANPVTTNRQVLQCQELPIIQ